MGSALKSKRKLAAILIVIVALSTTGISAYTLINMGQSSQQTYLLNLILLQLGQSRIVSGAPNIDEILYGLGLGNNIVGCTVQSDYPPKLMQRIALGQVDNRLNWWAPSPDIILALNPSVILLDQGQKEEFQMYSAFISQGKMAYLVLQGNSISQIETSIFQVANIFGKVSAAQTLVGAMENKIQTIEGNVSGQVRKNVLMVIWFSSGMISTVGNQTFLSEMISDAGGLNIYYDCYSDSWPTVPVAEAAAHNPNGIDIIVITAMGMSNFNPTAIYNELSMYPELTTTNAWKNNEVYFCSYGQADDLLMRPGPRVAEGVELLANMFFHNEVFNKNFTEPIHVIDNTNYQNYLTSLILG